MKYVCEYCKKFHDTIELANQCEVDCKKAIEEKENKRKRKEQDFNTLKESIKKYNEDYGTYYSLVEITKASPFNILSML